MDRGDPYLETVTGENREREGKALKFAPLKKETS